MRTRIKLSELKRMIREEYLNEAWSGPQKIIRVKNVIKALERILADLKKRDPNEELYAEINNIIGDLDKELST